MNLKEKQEIMKQAGNAFANGMPMEIVLAEYDVCYASVYNAIKKFNIPYRKTYGRTVFFDEDFFSKINTEEKAYWLGFIFADGSVTVPAKNILRLTIGVSIEDEEHIVKFKELIHHTGDFYRYTHNNSYSKKPISYLNFNSNTLCNSLLKLGCTQVKTGYSNMPKLRKDLVHHFVRGYFDGDGCLSVYTQLDKRNPDRIVSRLKHEFSITSDQNILLQIQEILMKECELPKTKLKSYKRTRKAHSLRYGGKKQIERIYHYLYKDATIFLERKYEKFQLLFL